VGATAMACCCATMLTCRGWVCVVCWWVWHRLPKAALNLRLRHFCSVPQSVFTLCGACQLRWRTAYM
jgi:transposase